MAVSHAFEAHIGNVGKQLPSAAQYVITASAAHIGSSGAHTEHGEPHARFAQGSYMPVPPVPPVIIDVPPVPPVIIDVPPVPPVIIDVPPVPPVIVEVPPVPPVIVEVPPLPESPPVASPSPMGV